MRKLIGILEDDLEGRIPAFRAVGRVLSQRGFEVVVHEEAATFVEWLSSAWANVSLVSLDHDLGVPREVSGTVIDPGEGMDVVRVLAGRVPAFPVIVHSSNPVGAERMMLSLQDAGWTAARLPPFGDHWIETAWMNRVVALLGL
ncbi:MAG: hypothetical protein IT452_23000 [Planctomycetia bacterium]|nr:hypothetical protein [Planctomycetia bacterium]